MLKRKKYADDPSFARAQCSARVFVAHFLCLLFFFFTDTSEFIFNLVSKRVERGQFEGLRQPRVSLKRGNLQRRDYVGFTV